MNRDMADMRENYIKGGLEIDQLADDPISQFNTWFDEALKSDQKEPNAMILSTHAEDGYPESRAVLLKEVKDGRLIFYTNHNSTKGRQLASKSKCHLLFLWLALERQVRVKGIAHKMTAEESYHYFKKRPRGSQIGAWSSPQSEVISDRSILESKVEEVKRRFAEEEHIPIPPFWGGYAIEVSEIEFWQGRSSRLHDRIKYTKGQDAKWEKNRLAP